MKKVFSFYKRLKNKQLKITLIKLKTPRNLYFQGVFNYLELFIKNIMFLYNFIKRFYP